MLNKSEMVWIVEPEVDNNNNNNNTLTSKAP